MLRWLGSIFQAGVGTGGTVSAWTGDVHGFGVACPASNKKLRMVAMRKMVRPLVGHVTIVPHRSRAARKIRIENYRVRLIDR
jgi:hypothetical protein